MRIDVLRIGDKVTHPDLYYGREIFEVILIYKNRVLLRGDWSGMFGYIQNGWYDREGLEVVRK